MVDIKLSISNAEVAPLLKRLSTFRKEVAAEIVEPGGEDSTTALVFTDRVIATLKRHQEFLKLGAK